MRVRFASPRHRRAVVGPIVALLLLSASCGSSETAVADPELTIEPVALEDIRLGLAVQSMNRTFFTGMVEGAQAAAASQGIALSVIDGQDDHDTQIAEVAAILPDIDALLLSPVDSERSSEITAMAVDAGVAVIAVANQVGSVENHGAQYVHPETVALVTNDDVSMGRKAGAFVALQDYEGTVSIAVLSGSRGTANVAMRLEGFESELDALGVDFVIVDDIDGSWHADGGHAACAAFVETQPDLIFSMSDAMTAGCVDALAGTALESTPIVSIGGNADGIELLTDGRIVGSVCQKPGDMGALAVDVAVNSLVSGNSSLGLKFYETPLVTADTMDRCDPQW